MPDDLHRPNLTDHPLAGIFPLMEGDEFARLVADIGTRGLLFPIVTLGGQILDGRNRYRACLDAGAPIRTETYEGDNPRGFVISTNLRRNPGETERAMAATKLANMERGDNQHAPIGATSQAEAAEQLSVSRRAVQRAAVVRERCIPELIAACERGKVAVSLAAKLADMPAKVQRAAVAKPDDAKNLFKRERRDQRESELAAATVAASKKVGTQLYGVIYADPPWHFEPYSTETGMDRAADNHYPTMDFEQLRAIKIPAAPDCVLFLWTTVPMLDMAMHLVELWDFDYKSSSFWQKSKAGTGFWYRNEVEILLLATRGEVPAPAPGKQPRQWIFAKQGRHSEKPDRFAIDIEALFPRVPKLEMFARRPRAGWDTWGNEA